MTECYLCLRITPQQVMTLSHRLFDKTKAHTIGKKVCLIIMEAYEKNPTILCGKTTKGILGGLFYLLKDKTTIAYVARQLDCSRPTIVKSYHLWLKYFPEYFQEIPLMQDLRGD